MQCMKCGREIRAGEVFCQECLDDMKRYPVKPGTAVHIPKQPQPRKSQDRRAILSPEKKIQLLTRRVRVLSWLLALAVAAVIGLGALVIRVAWEEKDLPIIGQNYSSASQTETTEGTE